MREGDFSTVAASGQGAVEASLRETSLAFRMATMLRRVSRQGAWPVLVLLWLAPGPVDRDYALRLVLGLPWWVAALALRVWARGYHRSEGFVLNGPYRYVRNPVELGSLLGYVGAAIFLDVPATWALLVLVLAWGYLSFLAAAYEKELILRVGPSYYRYARRVRRWWPTWLPGVNRAIRTYSVSHGVRAEFETLLWLVGFGIVFGLRSKYGALW